MRTRERLTRRLIASHAQSRLDKLSVIENSITAIDSFRNMSMDVLPGGRTTSSAAGAVDGYAITNHKRFPLKRFTDAQQRLECAPGTGTRLGYAFDCGGGGFNRAYQSKTMGTSGQLLNWVASANAFIVPGQIDPTNTNSSALSSVTAVLLFAISANATYSMSTTIVFPGRKLFSIWVMSGSETNTNFELQVTAGTWVSFTATTNYQRFTVSAATGAALLSIRIAGSGDSVFLWGPQLALSSNIRDLYPSRQLVADVPITDGTTDQLITTSSNAAYGSVLFELNMLPLNGGSDDTSILISNGPNPALSIPKWEVSLNRVESLVNGVVATYDSEGNAELAEFLFALPASGKVKLGIVANQGISVTANGVFLIDGFGTWTYDNFPNSVYVNLGLKIHLVSLYRWKESFSWQRMQTMTAL